MTMINKTIVHVVPQNTSVCGGIKVHCQLSEIENELGYKSYVAFPKNVYPSWFKTTANFITYEEAEKLHPDLVVGWEDPMPLYRFVNSKKVCYIQGEIFFKWGIPYTDIIFWFVSLWNKNKINRPGYLISPFIDKEIFYPKQKFMITEFPLKLLVLERKFGSERWNEVYQFLVPEVRQKISITLLPDSSEEVFADTLRKNDMFFASSYPEGLPLPSLEAMTVGTFVFGYSGGGGTDYMISGENCIFVKDGDAISLAGRLNDILLRKDVFSWLNKTILNANVTASKYSRENTIIQLKNALQDLLND